MAISIWWSAYVANPEQDYRAAHQFGNRLLTVFVATVFGKELRDMLPGYRVLSRRFVKSFPALASGFETETELTVHALTLNLPIGEIETAYRMRPEGSASKLRTYSDGLRILRTIVMLIKEEKPLQFFSVSALILLILGLAIGLPVVATFMQTGLVPRLPSAVLATGLVMLSFLSEVCGLILDSVARGRKEIKRLVYLSIPTISLIGEQHTVTPSAAGPQSRNLASAADVIPR